MMHIHLIKCKCFMNKHVTQLLSIHVVIVHVNAGIEIKSISAFFYCIQCVTWGLHHNYCEPDFENWCNGIYSLTVCSVLNMSINLLSNIVSLYFKHFILSSSHTILSDQRC